MKIHKDYFFKILGLNSLSIILKILMGVVSTKLISIYIGLNGISLLESFRNFTAMSEGVSQLGLQSGVTKEIATSVTAEREKRIFSTALGLSGVSTLLLILICVAFHRPILWYLFQSFLFEKVFFIFLICLPSIGLQTLIISILNGKQYLKKIIWVNSVSYGINIILSLILIKQWGLQGVMLQMAIAPLLLWGFTWIFTKRLLNLQYSLRYFDKNIAKSLLGFTLMNLVSSTLIPFSLIYIRNMVEHQIGNTEAGIWSSIIRLSSFYMMFVSSLCSLYFYPLLSKNESREQEKKTIAEYFKKFIPIVVLGLIFCYVFQDFVINILFSKEFLILNQYFYLQLISDFIKSCALIFGFHIIAKRKVAVYILFEIISIASKIILTYFCIQEMGLSGAFIANIISITIYLILVFFAYKKSNFSPENEYN